MPTQARAIKKRMSLLKAAHLEFAEVGYAVATAKSIASRAGVATGTFYQYFENKNEILCFVAENRFVELHDKVAQLEDEHEQRKKSLRKDSKQRESVAEHFKRVLSFLYHYHLAELQLHQVLDQRRSLDSQLDKIMCRGEDLMRGLVLRYIENYGVDDSAVVADCLHAMGEGLVHRMVFSTQSGDHEKMLETSAAMLASYFQSATIEA